MNRRTLLGSGTLRALAGACLVLLAATVSIAPQIAFAQANPVAQAQKMYDNGDFVEALAKVKDALASGAVSGSDAVEARELMARCQAKTGDVEASKKTFLQILHQDPQYRIDEVRTPPDEVVVFRQALQIFLEEQAAKGQRIPASITAFYGIGSGANEDFGEYVAQGGGSKSFDTTPEFGMSVRFPLAPKWSLDLEMVRFRATNEDSVSGPAKATYELTATPLVISVVYLVRDSGKLRLNVFAGGGPMLNSYAADKFLYFGSIPLKVTDAKTGIYFAAGGEAEYVLRSRISLTGRLQFRSAKATKMFEGSTFTQYGGEPIGDRDMDFSGFGLHFGLRGYIGY